MAEASLIEKVSGKKSPPEWGDDPLSKFIEMAKDNIWASFVGYKQLYTRLQKIDEAYRRGVEHLTNTRDWFPSFFFIRAHSAFLGACRLALSCQVGEAYMVLRGCLENGLYGFYFWKHPKTARLWYERHDSKSKRKECEGEFRLRKMLKLLESDDRKLGKIAANLYEWCIDYGAHPNERSISSVMERIEETKTINFQINYLLGDKVASRACLKTAAQVGVCCLWIFQKIFQTRFELIGLSDEIKRLAKGL